MKPRADEEDILTGDDAAEHVTETWQNLGHGLVDVEVRGSWLVVQRKGGDYTAFFSLVDDTAVTILNDGATTRHIPKALRPEESVSDEGEGMLARASENKGCGVYPLPDEGVFVIHFKEDDGYKELAVGLTSDRFEIVDEV